MKKIISVLALGFVLSAVAMQAQVQTNNTKNIIETHKATSVSNDDMNMLFGDSNGGNVIALSNEEMSETKGEGLLLGLGISLGISGIAWLGNCLLNGSCKDFNFSFGTNF